MQKKEHKGVKDSYVMGKINTVTMAYAVKCSPEDPDPSELLSSNIDTFVPFWLKIVNLSLQIGKQAKYAFSDVSLTPLNS